MLEISTQAPYFSSLNQNNQMVSLTDFIGNYVLVYFYPQDDTPGCTKEACSIRDSFDELSRFVTILGVSSDSVESHKKFAEKYHLPFTLVSDPEMKIITEYGANGFSTKRISYLIDPKGIIVKTYPKVNPTQHAQEILADVKLLKR